MTTEQQVCLLMVAADNLAEMMAFLSNPDVEELTVEGRDGKARKAVTFEAQGRKLLAVEGDYLVRDMAGRCAVARIQCLD